MRGAFIFLGVSLCVLSGVSSDNSTLENSGGSFGESSYRCGNKTENCESYCGLCSSINIPRTSCYQVLVHGICNAQFENAMDSINSSGWCTWDKVKSAYNKLTQCTEEIADCLLLPWPNKLVEQIFVGYHTTYFQECPTETLRDPPPNVIFALVMTPICLIPAMVVLVVMKTKNGDRRS